MSAVAVVVRGAFVVTVVVARVDADNGAVQRRQSGDR